MQADLAIAELKRSLDAGTPVYAVHYACESFNKTGDGPAGVSAIGVSPVRNGGQEWLFSITDQRSSTPEEAKAAEISLLTAFQAWLRDHADARLVHWDMDKAGYGFGPIAARYAFLTAEASPPPHSEDRMFNLDKLLAHRYGQGYVPHPRLSTLVTQNGITTRYSLTGEEQAARFDRGDHVAIGRCISERSGNIASLADLFVTGRLKTTYSGPSIRFVDQLIDSVAIVVELSERLELVAASLQKRYDKRPTVALTDEYDYQDLFGALLRVFFEDVQREEHVPTYAGGTSRIDFVLRDVGVAIELKRAGPTLGVEKVGAQLSVDITRYAALPGVRHLICLVYDDGHYVDNPRGLERDLTKTVEGLSVTVRVLD